MLCVCVGDVMAIDYNKTDGLSLTTRKMTGHNSRKTQSAFAQATKPTANRIVYKQHTDGRQAQHTKGKDA